MELIIALLVAATAAMGLSKVELIKLARKWGSQDVDRYDLYETYAAVASAILAFNFVVLAFRKLYELSGGSFYPTYVTRTPLEWALGAMLCSFVFWILFCCLFNDIYNQIKDQGYRFSEARKKKWRNFQIFNGTMFVFTYGYQVYFYGWGLGF